MYCLENNGRLFCASITAIFLSLLSCNTGQEKFSLYPVDSVLTAQVKYLTAKNARLQKGGTIALEQDDSVYTPTESMWEKELEIFQQLQMINKKGNRENYIVRDGILDKTSNLTIKSFTAREDMPVQYLKIFYQTSPDQPRKIEGLYAEKNALMKTERLITLEFEQIENTNVLTSYSIRGGQKIILGDTVEFTIAGKIFID